MKAAERPLRWLGRRYPLLQGYDRILHSSLVRRLMPVRSEDVTVTLRSGHAISVPMDDDNGRELALFGTCEPAITRICRSLLRPGDTFLDIGANYGAVGCACGDVIGEGAELHFFEPNPDLGDRIPWAVHKACAAIHVAALSDENGTARLSIPTGRSGMGRLSQEGAAVVNTMDTASFLARLPAGPVCAKVDVEGAELKILPALIADERVRFVVFESWPHNRDGIVPILEAAHARGFALLAHERSAFRVKLRPIGPEGMGDANDFLLVRRN